MNSIKKAVALLLACAGMIGLLYLLYYTYYVVKDFRISLAITVTGLVCFLSVNYLSKKSND